jgi:hypothetical protein
MKIQPTLLLVIILLVMAYATNPKQVDHETGLRDGLNQLHATESLEFIHNCTFHNYYVFSFAAYMGQPVSFGLVNNVHILYNNLELCEQDFFNRNRKVAPRGRGTPN